MDDDLRYTTFVATACLTSFPSGVYGRTAPYVGPWTPRVVSPPPPPSKPCDGCGASAPRLRMLDGQSVWRCDYCGSVR